MPRLRHLALRLARALPRLALAAGLGAAVTGAPRPADAAVSVAVLFDDLVADADAIAVVAPGEARSAWENGRIVTYTRLEIEDAVAGSAERAVWVKTLGGVVDGIGQLVEGEPTFHAGTRSLVFLHRIDPTTFVVAARSQGQYVLQAAASGAAGAGGGKTELTRATNVGALVFPGQAARARLRPPRALTTRFAGTLAQDVLQFRSLDAVRPDLAEAFSKLHAR